MKSFLQTKDWAKFQEAFGRKVFWIDDKLVVKFDLPLGKSWLYLARPELKTDDLKLKTFLKELSKLAQKENAIFCKVELDINFQFSISNFHLIFNSKQFNNLTIQQSKCLQPQDELVLDISLSEDKLLEQMHPKTRYNIRLAQKKDLKIKFSHDPKDVDTFYNLAIKTSERDGFKYHSREYYKKMIEILSNGKDVKIELVTIFSKNQNENKCHLDLELVERKGSRDSSQAQNDLEKIYNSVPISSAILLYHNNMCYYLHGASDWTNRQLMAPYLMQWEGIHRAKKKGYKYYNFGGVAQQVHDEEHRNLETKELKKLRTVEQKKSSLVSQFFGFLVPKSRPAWASWSGITRFKMGFINQAPSRENCLHYPDVYDIVYQPVAYWGYRLLKKIKKLT